MQTTDEIIDKQDKQIARITLIESELQNQDTLFEKIVDIESAITEQRGILNAALGHVLPVHMPPQWNEQLEELENQLSEPESWPTDASQAKQFVRAVSALVSELTPLAESTYFTRLAPLRWVAVAFDALYREGDLGETAFNRADQLRAIADAKLEGVDLGTRSEIAAPGRGTH